MCLRNGDEGYRISFKIMSFLISDIENFLFKVVVFFIVSLLIKIFDENFSIWKISEFNLFLMDFKEKGNWWKDC